MRTYLLLIAALTVLVPACGGEDTTHEERSPSAREDVGTLQLALRGVDADMQSYRLRNAAFDVSGTRFTDFTSVTSTLSSETDLESATLRAPLVYGSYSVGLRAADWYLERITPSGAERVTRAILLSSSVQSVFVSQGQLSRVAFQFGVDGELIDFAGGELEIGIEIQRAPDAGAPPPVP